MTSRDYQSEDIEKIFDAWKEHRSALYVAATGLGKSHVMSEVAKRFLPKRSLMLVHRGELIYQARETFEENGIQCDIEKAELVAGTNLFNRADCIMAMVQTMISGEADRKRMHRFNPLDFGLLLYDECVPARTLVDGIPIETIKVGQYVKTQLGYGRVWRTSNREISEICEIEFDDGSRLVCSLNHPIWTTNGFILASGLTKGSIVATITEYECMQNLQAGNTGWKVALRRPELQVAMVASNYPEIPSEAWGRNNPFQKDERDEQARGSSQSFHYLASNALEASSAKRQRLSSNNSRDGAFMCSGMAVQRGCEQQASNCWFSELLQAGHWEYRFEDWGGSGWTFSQGYKKTDGRQKEGGIFGFKRVESIAIHKQGGGDGFERVCPEGRVYNLEVSNGNTYFANGTLVHNSHHAPSPGNKSIVDYFTSGNPDLRVLGVTATPTRADEKAMGQIFETVIEPVRDILFGIENGWLVNIEQKYVSVSGVDLSHIATTCGDLNTGQLSKEMEKEENIQGVVQPTLEYLFRQKEKFLDSFPVETWGDELLKIGNPRRAIAFTVSVAQSEMLCNIFNRVIPEIAHWVCGKTEDGRRMEILRDFKDGKTSILCNVGVTTEGYNNPFVDMIVMARPTKSEVFYRQAIGRGTRVLQGIVDGLGEPQERLFAIAASRKTSCLVLDIVGNSGRHSLVSTADVLAGDYDEEIVERAKEKAKKSSSPVRMIELMEQEAELQRKAAERKRQIAESHKKSMVARTNYKTVDVNPFSVLGLTPARTRGWDDGRTLSEGQRGVLLKNGIQPDQHTYAEQRQLLNEIFRRYDSRLARFKQINCIKKYAWAIGLNKDTFDFKSLKADEASKMIDEIATKQNWTKRTPQTA